MKYLFLVSIITGLLIRVKAQQKDSSPDILSSVNTISSAESFIKTHPGLSGKLFSLNSGNDTSEIALPLYHQKSGFKFIIDGYTYKIVNIDSVLSFRVSYIYIDGERFSKNQVDSIRNEIISGYKMGTLFYQLAEQYNMDGNITGDLGWFTQNMMVPEFEAAVKAHKKGDIFTIDMPSRNWYHVVLKTHDDTYIKKITVLKIKSNS